MTVLYDLYGKVPLQSFEDVKTITSTLATFTLDEKYDVALTGSYKYGNNTASSDIDLAMYLPSGFYQELEQVLCKNFGARVLPKYGNTLAYVIFRVELDETQVDIQVYNTRESFIAKLKADNLAIKLGIIDKKTIGIIHNTILY